MKQNVCVKTRIFRAFMLLVCYPKIGFISKFGDIKKRENTQFYIGNSPQWLLHMKMNLYKFVFTTYM